MGSMKMEKIRRIVAFLTVVLIVGLLVAALVSAFLGSPYFLAFMLLAIGVPGVLYIFMWFTRLVTGDDEADPGNRSAKG